MSVLKEMFAGLCSLALSFFPWKIQVNISSERPIVQMLNHFIALDSCRNVSLC